MKNEKKKRKVRQKDEPKHKVVKDDDDFATIERLAHEMSDMFEEEKEAEELVKKSRGDEAPEKEEGMSRDINADAEAVKEEARIIREELKAEKELLNKEKEMKAKLDEELLKLKTAQEVEVQKEFLGGTQTRGGRRKRRSMSTRKIRRRMHEK